MPLGYHGISQALNRVRQKARRHGGQFEWMLLEANDVRVLLLDSRSDPKIKDWLDAEPYFELEVQLHRMKELYGWGDITRGQYLVEREAIHKQLHALAPIEEQSRNLSKLAQFLANVADAWDAANQEQRNKLVRCLFQEVWIKDKEVVAVKPQPELKPFFDLNHEAMQEKLSQNFGEWRPRGDSNPRSPP